MNVYSIPMLLIALTIAVFCEPSQTYNQNRDMELDERLYEATCDSITFLEINETIIPVEIICE